MSTAQDVWRRKSDDEVVAAAAALDDYTDEGRAIILAEATRRHLNVVPLVDASREQASTRSESRRCAYCDTWLLFGGKLHGAARFCNETCRLRGARLTVSEHIPAEQVKERLLSIFAGSCPQCAGTGPVDVQTSYRVVSMIVFTRWSSHPEIACRSCGRRARLRNGRPCSNGLCVTGWPRS
jgi:hypothetical protein